jgi:polyisoprenoid-binding protein YceI
MRVKGRWKHLWVVTALAGLLAGCAGGPGSPAKAPATSSAAGPSATAPGSPTAPTSPATAAAGGSVPAGAPLAETPAPHVGTPYDVSAPDSLLTLVVYRGGTLASAGHNHVIASHDLTGTIYVAADPLQSSFELHVPVVSFTVDEFALRAQQASADFPPAVSEGAKQGTRHNMLGSALLDAENSPEIVLRALRMEKTGDTESALARVQCTVRGQARTLAIPVHYEIRGAELTVSGDTSLRQSDLGLKPFSAMLGALQVQDEMRVSFRIVARAATGKTDQPSQTP